MTTLRAPAKLTWFLDITGVRENGYHEVRSEMVSLDLCDELTVEENASYLRISGEEYVRLAGVSTDENNIVERALRLVGKRAGVTLHKSIPVGGGLGGGSSDAAAILRWAGYGDDNETALRLGSDVPFCLRGGRSLVSGIGEEIEDLEFLARDLTLIVPSFGIDTAACYGAYDEMSKNGQLVEARNALEAPARRIEPRLDLLMNWVKERFERPAFLAGSGSTVYVEGHVQGGVARWDEPSPAGDVHVEQTATTPKIT
jgi:4-diphosphocytidyl-2-C-methyl-D-erythritol kinase